MIYVSTMIEVFSICGIVVGMGSRMRSLGKLQGKMQYIPLCTLTDNPQPMQCA